LNELLSNNYFYPFLFLFIKDFQDEIYGGIKLDEFLMEIVETEQFKILKNISAFHDILTKKSYTVFDHSIGFFNYKCQIKVIFTS